MWTALGLWWLDDDEELDGEIAALVTQRDDARARRDWAEADRVRDVLRDQGIVLEDTADGTVWRRLRPDDEV
jgi:cysteinyl-tRNA synthetase